MARPEQAGGVVEAEVGRGGVVAVDLGAKSPIREINSTHDVYNRCSPRVMWATCTGVFVLLAAWAWIFPFTGDGDSVLHYRNTLQMWDSFKEGLQAWSRPVVKLYMLFPSLLGIYPARLAMALLTAVTVWQTIRLAEDLKIPRAWLAGVFFLGQPYAFALGADTMTEIPMALGFVLAIRLWINGKLGWSCLVVGFMPAVRPEGFFLGLVWGALVLVSPRSGWNWRGIGRRAALLGLMTVGLLSWCMASWIAAGDFLYLVTTWFWVPESYSWFESGPIYHYAVLWPTYCGVPLTALFFVGIVPSLRTKMTLPWLAWWIVFGVHSFLFWKHAFASCGLIRIMAASSTMTALICLFGWNTLVEWVWRMREPQKRGPAPARIAGVVAAVVVMGWSLYQYTSEASRWECFPLMRCINYVRDHKLLAHETVYFTGNRLDMAALGRKEGEPNCVGFPCNYAESLAKIRALPVGSIGIWNNQQAWAWHGLTIQQLEAEGFEVLHLATEKVWGADMWHKSKSLWNLQYAVMRKTRMPDDVLAGEPAWFTFSMNELSTQKTLPDQ